MAPELGASELPLTNDRVIASKEMETEDIEDGEILEDESNDGELPPCEPERSVEQLPPEEKNNFEGFFSKEKRTHHHHRPRGHQESHKSFRRDRASFPPSGLKKRRRSDDEAYRSDKFYAKKNKRSDADAEDGTEDDMIFMLGGSLRDVERKMKGPKKPTAPSLPETMIDPIVFNEGENQDPRPYARRSPPSERRDRMKKDRGLVRGVGGGPLKRRGGRGGPVVRKENQRDTANEVCSFFAQGKCLRGGDCPYLHPCNQPRKLEICKFYLNDCCTKRDKCIYMHGDFPCKYFHLPGLTCSLGTKCKFSHSKLDEVQRAVLKKYADVPMKEVDEMQKFYRETANGAPPARSKEKKDSRIPSLFDIKVAVPREYREGQEGEGVTTPIPSPESMVYDNDDGDEKSHKHHHKQNKILAEQNDHKHEFGGEELEPSGSEITPKHKKKSRKTDEFSDSERSRKDKKKKKSKKEDKDGERSEKKRKKKDKVRRNKSENMEDAFAVGLNLQDDRLEANTDEKIERESADAFAHLPKKQQELFLRIQQHQKEADPSQNANVDEQNEEDDSKPDVNWYSSDEEETPEPVQEESTSSPLATLLRTIQTTSSSNNSSNIVPNIEKAIDEISAPVHLFSTPPVPDNESVPMVDASQLANIDLSDEVTQILTSIMKTESASSCSDTISNTLPPDPDKVNDYLLSSSSSSVVRKPFPGGSMEMLPSIPARKASSEDLGSIFRNAALFGFSGATHSSSDSPPKDIDLRQLPFKPIPVHDAANEIDASITSHPPMEYKLIPLSPIPKVNYAVMIDAARNAARDDPRFKRKAPVAVTESMTEPIAKPSDPRFEQKTHSEGPVRSDPRIRNDPRLAAAKIIPAMTSVPVMPPMNFDPRMDPRLLSVNAFPPEQTFSSYQMAAVAAAAAAAAVSSLPQSGLSMLAKEPTSLRKEDPRLRFRTNQNA